MRALITDAMRKLRPGVRVIAADGPAAALRAVVDQAHGSPVLFVYEKLDPALAALDALGATPWPEEDLMGALDEPGVEDENDGGVPAADQSQETAETEAAEAQLLWSGETIPVIANLTDQPADVAADSAAEPDRDDRA
jgi:hypothetical protein